MDKFVDTGFIISTSALSVYASTPKYIQWGTGGGVAPAHGDTSLSAARNEIRVAGAVSLQTTNVTNDSYQSVGTLTVSGTSAVALPISEVGLFDSAGVGGGGATPTSGGNMFTHSTFSGLPLSIGDAITFTIKFIQTAA